MSKQLEKKHPLAARWMHWINFPVLAMMIWNGLLIYWANQVYSIRIAGVELLHLFPQWFYDTLGIPQRLAEGLQLHFFFMWFFAINGVIYVIYTFFLANLASIAGIIQACFDRRRLHAARCIERASKASSIHRQVFRALRR